MTGIRDARAVVIRARYRDLCDDLHRALPLLLDDLDALDQEALATGGDVSPELTAEIAGEPAPVKPVRARKPRGGTAT